MSYHLRSKPKHEHRPKIFLAVIVFALLSVSMFLFPVALRGFFYTISRPFWFTGTVIESSFGTTLDYFRTKGNLISDNNNLNAEVSRLKLKEVDYDSLLKENQSLKSELGRTDVGTKIFAKVLSRPPQSPYDTLVIDAGSVNGVISGGKVYLSDSIIVGIVKTVNSRFSTVELFSSGNHKEELILSRTGTSFEILGNGGANFKLEVPKDADIIWGDTFIYPGLNHAVVASVYYIDENSQSSFKTIYLRIPQSIFSADSVFIEKI